jgi:soluble lytic murein transglycosylase-like protein
MKTRHILTFAICAIISNQSSASIYRYKDDSGRIFLSNTSHVIIPELKVKIKPHAKRTIVAHVRHPIHHRYTKAHIAKIIRTAATKHHVEEKLLHAVIQTESSYDSDAISKVGAVGLMQLMPATAARFGVIDRTDPNQSIDGGTKYLKHLLTLFKGNKRLAIAGYNAGENAVIRHNRSIPPYPETIAYVSNVMTRYKSN